MDVRVRRERECERVRGCWCANMRVRASVSASLSVIGSASLSVIGSVSVRVWFARQCEIVCGCESECVRGVSASGCGHVVV